MPSAALIRRGGITPPAHEPWSSVEPFTLGGMRWDSVEPFDLKNTPAQWNSVEGFNFGVNQEWDSVEPFYLGPMLSWNSVELWDIRDAATGTIGGATAHPRLGYRDRVGEPPAPPPVVPPPPPPPPVGPPPPPIPPPPVPPPTGSGGPAIGGFVVDSGAIGPWGMYQGHFDIAYVPVHPNDINEIAVTARFVDPVNGPDALVMPCFYARMQNVAGGTGNNSPETYTNNGGWHWFVRYKPRVVGNWSFVVVVSIRGGRGGTSVSASQTFTVSGGAGMQPLKMDSSRKYLQLLDGTPFYPNGINYAFEDRNGKSTAYDGQAGWSHFMPRMASGGFKLLRRWMHGHSRENLEYKADASFWAGYPSLNSGVTGDYSQQAAARLDNFMATAQANGLRVILVLWEMNEFNSYDGGAAWSESTYNVVNGGPCTNPQDVFTDPTALRLFYNRVWYAVARWGAYGSLGLWEYMNEIGSTGSSGFNGYNSTTHVANVLAWFEKIGKFLRSLDIWAAPLTLSQEWEKSTLGQPAGGHFDSWWLSPYLDVISLHRYHDSAWSINSDNWTARQMMIDARNRTGKMVILEESGLNRPSGVAPEPDFDPTTSSLSTAQIDHILVGTHYLEDYWVATLSGGGNLPWWWTSGFQDDSVKHRTSGTLPNSVNWDFSTRYALAVPGLNAFLNGENMATASPPYDDVSLALTGSLRAVGWGNRNKVLIFAKDSADAYDSGSLPGDVAARTVSGGTIQVNGLINGVPYNVERWNPYSGALISTIQLTAASGHITISPAAIDRSVAYKVYI